MRKYIRASDIRQWEPRIDCENVEITSGTDSIDLSLRRCRFQLRISTRIAFTALAETAGLKLMKNLPLRFFDLRGRKV